ncbi:MAG: endonuclease/exonuclease/phosphatase family protein [Deltaproteobacteria bacterium]|nr:endonuclease/exonuclease/phosphatase family protein [Deltaproteobacteria bacterium]
MSLRIASYNVHGCVGRGGFDLQRVAQVIVETEAHVVGLQEVGDVHGDTPSDDQAIALAEATGMELVYAPNLSRGSRRYGNAILSRLRVLRTQTYDLSVAGREPRGCVRADLELGGGAQVHVFNLHLGLSFKERRRQAALLLSDDILHDATLAFPAVVVGDFNFWLPGPAPRLLRSALLDVGAALGRTEPTYPSRWPFLRLDRIYLGPGLLPRWLRVHQSARAMDASDHLPLVAAVEPAHPPTAEALPATNPS